MLEGGNVFCYALIALAFLMGLFFNAIWRERVIRSTSSGVLFRELKNRRARKRIQMEVEDNLNKELDARG